MGDVPDDIFQPAIENAYKEITHWKRNIFQLPFGKHATAFINELSRLYRAYAEATSLERIAIKAAFVLQVLLLQKPHPRSKARDHSNCLGRRMLLWKEGKIAALLHEGQTIQKQLKSKKSVNSRTDNRRAQVFAKMMTAGNVRQAIRMTNEDNQNNGVLDLSEKYGEHTVLDILKEKHPPAQPAQTQAIVEQPQNMNEPHPVIFDQLDCILIKQIAMKVQGSAGPSEVDAYGWRRFCTIYKIASQDLCNSIAAMARRIATTYVDPDGLSALTACRLIPLNKNPGVRPIGICETLRRITSKAILSVMRKDVMAAAGPLQLCAGLDSGCESAVHTMRKYTMMTTQNQYS